VPSEKRTRVEIFLPARSESTEYQTVTEWLAEELAYARGGSTLTTPFIGLYTSTAQANLVRDAVHVLFCDFNFDTDNPTQRVELTSYLNELRLLLMEVLREEEVWIIYHSVTRVGGEQN
jgi:hypothetical protein